MQHCTETRVEQNGTIILRDLPFHEGDKVLVVITAQPKNATPPPHHPLRGLPVEYRDPFDPVAEQDWEALS